MRRAGWWLAVALAWAAPALAVTPRHVETVTLKNGLRLVLAPDPEARSVDVAVWYDAGSRHDAPGRTGVAHLFEHLMFRGSSHYPDGEHGRLVRNEGGTSGAYAAHDFIAFYETLPPDALDLAFRLEADRMSGLTLSQQALDGERAQVAGERERRNSPITLGLDRAWALAFPDHAYGLPVFGRESDLARITLKNCRDFYQAHFGPAQAVVTVVGNFSRDAALELARKHLEPVHGSAARAAAPPLPKKQSAERRSVERAPVPLRVLLVAWPIPPRAQPDWAPLSMLSTLLTRGEDSRLQKALGGDPPLCFSVQGDIDARRDASLFYLVMAVAPSADSAQVERKVFSEIERLAREPLGEADLERARRQAEVTVDFGLQTTRARGQAIGSGVALGGGPDDLDHLLERMRAAKSADVQRAAASLGASSRNVVWLLPESQAGGGGGSAGSP
jgi:zinc protease